MTRKRLPLWAYFLAAFVGCIAYYYLWGFIDKMLDIRDYPDVLHFVLAEVVLRVLALAGAMFADVWRGKSLASVVRIAAVLGAAWWFPRAGWYVAIALACAAGAKCF